MLDRQEYIEIILDHHEHPRNKHRMEDATVQLGGGNPGCGDLITMYLKIEGDRIAEASYIGEGCTISQAGGSIMTEVLEGLTLNEVAELGKDTMIEEIGEDAVKSRVRCATLALGTAQAAVKQFQDAARRKAEGLEPATDPVSFEN